VAKGEEKTEAIGIIFCKETIFLKGN